MSTSRSPVPPIPPLRSRLHGSIATEGARARRTLRYLAFGHLGVLATHVPVAVLLVRHTATDEAGYPFDGTSPMFAIGAVALAAGQILSVHKLHTLARSISTDVDTDQIARSLRRSTWAIVFVLYAIMLGPQLLSSTPTRPILFALFLLLITAALLLEFAHAGWVHTRLNDHGERNDTASYRVLPPGIGTRIRNRQQLVVGAHALHCAVAVALLGLTIATGTREDAGAALASTVQIIIAATATVVPLLPVRAALLVRKAITGDVVHLATFRRAKASLLHIGAVAFPLTVLAIAAIPVARPPAAPTVAITRSTLLFFALAAAAMQFSGLNSIEVGDFPKRFRRAAHLGSGGRPRPRDRPTEQRDDEFIGGSAEPDHVFPVSCPGCRHADQVQPVPALSAGGSGAGGVVSSGPAAWLPPPADRYTGQRAVGCALAAAVVMTLVVGIAVVPVLPPGGPGQFIASVVAIWTILLPGALIVAALLWVHVSLRGRTARRREQVAAAIARWRLGYYCHRCGGAFFAPGIGQTTPQGRLMSAGEFRDAVQGGYRLS